jgi:DnaJ-class molecular chaperone
MTTHYDTLKVPQDANADTIKKQYRKLSLDHHPDRPSGNSAKFKELNEAYEVLSDPKKRREYDASFHPSPEHAIFEMLFKGNGAVDMFSMGGPPPMFFHQPPVRLAPVIVHLRLTLDQAFAGCSVPVELQRTIYEGRSKRLETETLYVDVPAGIDNNEVIVVEQKGNVGPDYEVGDVRVVVQIDNPTKMVRNGLDLIYTHPLTLKDALCGFTFELEYLNGKQLKIANQEGNIVTPQLKKTIPNMGMKRDHRQGALIIMFAIQFPPTLTLEQIETLKTVLP